MFWAQRLTVPGGHDPPRPAHAGVSRGRCARLAALRRAATAIVQQGPAGAVSLGPGVARWDRPLHASQRAGGSLPPGHDRHLPSSRPTPSRAGALERAADAAPLSGDRAAVAGAQPRAVDDGRSLVGALQPSEPRPRSVAAALVPPLYRPARASHLDPRVARLALRRGWA